MTFDQLKANVDGAALSCCKLVKNTVITDKTVTVSYLPFDPNRSMVPGRDTLVLELEFRDRLAQDAAGKWDDVYDVTLLLHRQ